MPAPPAPVRPDLRTRLAGAVIAGLLDTFWGVEDQHPLAAGHDEIVLRWTRSLDEFLVPTT